MTLRSGSRISCGMLDMQNPEDRLIRNILLGAAASAVAGLLVVATAIAVTVSANFNVLAWME